MASHEIEGTLTGLLSEPGVEGYIVINYDGIPVRSYPENNELSVQYAALIADLVAKTKATLKQLDPSDSDFTYLRMRTKNEKEVIVTNQIINSCEYILITLHSCKFIKDDEETKEEGDGDEDI
ncbi:unnamed protein product [Moneuplotes crassus]|uniref:Roadblock/LAMTOR2 domain-containing protein n=1 Tax=Euplotes crassus TaxID=5936 RepID=A0AAD2D9M3_EUPCR|nr:unnamed protein product [Moneuplotes crassus]